MTQQQHAFGAYVRVEANGPAGLWRLIASIGLIALFYISSTLLAAMLRADDIPSRTVSGLVYVSSFEGAKDIFGYHMWTQGWIAEDGKGRWVDLDATLVKEARS